MIDFIIGFLGALGMTVGGAVGGFMIAFLLDKHPVIFFGIIVFGICCGSGYIRMKQMRN